MAIFLLIMLIFHLLVYKRCRESNEIKDYRTRNVIFVQNDSIIIKNSAHEHFDSLITDITSHIANSSKSAIYFSDAKKALLFHYQDPLFKKEQIKQQLLKIAIEFNNLNSEYLDTLPLNIMLNDYPFISIAAPPMPIGY